MDKNKFLKDYSSFQSTHTCLTLFFLFVLAIQAILFFTTNISEYLLGYKVTVLLGSEIIIYLLVSKIHANKKGIFCPTCSKDLMYKFGLKVKENGSCPHCGENLFEQSS